MTVYERGYRAYTGTLEHGHPVLTIAAEGIRAARARLAFKVIAVIYLIWFVVCAFVLYIAVGTDLQGFGRMFGISTDVPGGFVLATLNVVLGMFYGFVAILTALLAVFVGSGLIADDLAAGALPLYLVRPMRGRDYVLGKALVIPGILAYAILLPGLFFYLLAAFWQPPGEAWSFLFSHLEIPARVFRHYLLAALIFSGLLLLLSSRTPRRGAVAVLAAAFLLAGMLINGIASSGLIEGHALRLLKLADLVGDTIIPIQIHAQATQPADRQDILAPEFGAFVVAVCLFTLGLVAAWRRTRSVEVIG